MIISAITKRRSIRAYKDDQIPDDMIREIIMAGQCAPTARGTNAVEYLVITDPVCKEKIFAIVGQEYVMQAPVLIMPVATDVSVLPIQDLSVASQNIFLQATEMGLGSVWKNISPEWEVQIKALCGVPSTYRVINLIPIGVPAEEHVSRTIHDGDVTKVHLERW